MNLRNLLNYCFNLWVYSKTFASVWRQCSTPGSVGSSEYKAKPDTEDSLTPIDFSSDTRNSDTVVEPSKLTTYW